MTIKYRTRLTKSDYEFDFETINNGWRIYILDQPGYRGRDESSVSTHRIFDTARGRRYICWTSPITTIGQAKTIAANWAESTDRYIASGNSTSAFAQPIFTDFNENPGAHHAFERLAGFSSTPPPTR